MTFIGAACLLALWLLGSSSRPAGASISGIGQSARCADRTDLVGTCFRVHGRLSFYNGNPSFRVWPVGTTRLLGLEPDERPTVPDNVAGFLDRVVRGDVNLFGDFRVCPLTPERLGEMRRVCMDSASNLVARKR
jgi:hypothetical protein